VVEAEAGVADREFSLIGSRNQYRNAQDRLIDVVLGPNLTPDSRLEIRPTDRPERLHQLLGSLVVPDVDEAAELAFQNRPELAIAHKAIEQNEINLQFARNQRLPQLDVEANLEYGGLGGDCNPAPGNPPLGRPCTGNPSRSFSQANHLFSHGRSASWGARGLFSIPLGNRQASGRASQADLTLRRSHSQLRRLEQDVVLQVRRAVRDIQSAAEGIEAAERRRLASEEQLRAETIRLEGRRPSGSSTASPPPSTSCSARRTSWAPSPRRSSPSRRIATRSRRSNAPRGPSCATTTSSSNRL
jgi:outer membrane protein TolC